MNRKESVYADKVELFSDDHNTPYMDSFGCIPFYRSKTAESLADTVELNPAFLENGLPVLYGYYEDLRNKGVAIYVSYACTNMDAVPKEQRDNVTEMNDLFDQAVLACRAVPVSTLSDYLFTQTDFYDTNYHLLSNAATDNTARWLRDLRAAMDEFPPD
ncbi:MAG: hypothetical protein IJ773_12430 [Lachnospiraceae bacterium]|nr:hypothetical protein [Lachnospiraceae bacterium]